MKRFIFVIFLCWMMFFQNNSVYAQTGNTYFVSNTGSDTNPGTLSLPFKTIQKGVNKLVAGDTLYVRGGIYTEKITINNSGTASSPITISSYPGETAIMDGSGLDPLLPTYTRLIDLYGSYIIIENFELTYPKGRGVFINKNASTGKNSTHNIIRNLNVHHMWSSGIGVWGDDNLIENNKVWQTVLNNKCDRSVPGNTCLTQSWSAPLFFGDSSHSYYGLNTIIRNNEVYQNYGEGILCMYTDNGLIENNRVWDNWAEGIYLDQCSFTKINNNLSYYTSNPEFWRFGTYPASGIMIGNEGIIASHPIGHNRLIFNNVVINAGQGFNFWTGLATGAALINDTIANNTFVNNNSSGIGITIGLPKNTNHQNTIIENNLFLVNNATPGSSTSNTGLTFSHNLWSKQPNASVVGVGDIIANPLLLDPNHIVDLDQINYPVNANWYQLTALSPAIDKGNDLSGMVTNDYQNVLRPQSAGFDIGAFEYIFPPGNTSFSCGWETTIIGSGCWLGKQIVADDRFQRVTSPVRTGNYAARVEVRPGDDPINSSGERSEVAVMLDQNGNRIYENETSGTQFYAFSVMLPTDWQTAAGSGLHDGYWGLIFQLHGPNVLAQSPAFGFEAKDKFSLDMTVGDVSRTVNLHDFYQFSDNSLNLGHWTDFVIKIKYTKDATGSVDIWRRNEGVTDFTNILSINNVATLQYNSNINSGIVGDHYWKTGFYRNKGTTLTNVLYLDGTSRGTTFDAVVAAAFPVSISTPKPSSSPNPADIDGSGTVNAVDLLLVLKNWLGIGTCSTFECDLNSDLKINALDAAWVIKYLDSGF